MLRCRPDNRKHCRADMKARPNPGLVQHRYLSPIPLCITWVQLQSSKLLLLKPGWSCLLLSSSMPSPIYLLLFPLLPGSAALQCWLLGLKRGTGKDMILNVWVMQTFHKQHPGLPCSYEKETRRNPGMRRERGRKMERKRQKAVI